MAAGILPRPGSKFGACVDECKHHDCTETRFIASSLCVICESPIGYDRGFYDERGNISIPVEERGLVHANCVEDRLSQI
jgi:hypothetical protein